MLVAKFPFRWNLCWVFSLFLAFGVSDSIAQERRSPGWYYRAGEIQLEKHRWDDALKSFNNCLREDPMYTDAYYSRAIVHEHFDSLNRALVDYNIYLEYHPEHHEALFSRAQVRMRLNQNALAKDDLLKLRTMPAGPTTAVYFRQDVYTGAVDKVFTSKGADKSYIFNALGMVDMRMENYHEAILYFDSALLASPNDPDVLVNRGTAKEKMRDTAEAIADFQKALFYNPQHAIAKHNLGSISKGKNLENVDPKLLDEAIEDNPNMPFAYSQRAYTNMQSGDFAKALKDYDKAISLDAKEPEYFLNRGLVKEKLKDLAGAYSDYTTAIKLQEDFDKAWLNRGNLLAKLGKLTEAVEDYSVAIVHSPDYASAYFNRAMVLNRLQQRDLACKDMHTAEQLGAKIEPRVWKSICN